MIMELQLNLALPDHNNYIKKDYGSHEPLWQVACIKNTNYIKGKRSFDHALGNVKETAQDLPLLVWSGQPNEEDDRNGQKKKTSRIHDKIIEEKNKVVGWPPIKSWRRKLLHGQHGVQQPREIAIQEENGQLLFVGDVPWQTFSVQQVKVLTHF